MRVAVVRREPNVAFSMDVYADNLVEQLKKIRPNWEIIEISPEPWSDDLENLWHSGNPLRKYYERFYNHPRVVSQTQADIFHIIDHTNGHVAYGLKKLGKPVLITCHDLVQYIYPEILKNESRFPAFSLAVWQHSVKGIIAAHSTIAVSTNTARDINKWLNVNLDRIKVIPNGVGTNFCVLPAEKVAQWRQKYVDSPAEICLLNVGSNHQRKNILTVLKAVKAIANLDIPVRLWKVGEKFYPEQEQYIKANGLAKHITLINNADSEALIYFYNAADVMLAPSLYEGFGLTILETMACGTPVITSNISSLPEVAGDAAILVEPTDVEAITKAVIRLQKDTIYRQNLINKGLVRVKEFTWKKTVEQTANLYEEIVNSRSKVPA
ncbi:MAG TPA: glycosyltransferase family 1 protein [Coleofasciculaceae cyanobacterium]|jgi:glycosyltransferase involved in cell wall biosynthesis